jgi:TatD DNase family protein
MLFDSHAHLDASQFDHDRELVIKRARLNGVSYILNPGADFESSVRAVELAEAHDFIFAGVGIHPHDAETVDTMMLELIEQMAKKERVKAIGEIGLDYYRDLSPRSVQKEVFIEQIRIAKRLDLPIIIHDRDANADVLQILKEEKAFATGVLMHCFSGSHELATQYVKLGAMISIAGPVTYKNARKTVEVVETIPLDRLFIETDSPYLSPEPMRGKRNEPMFVRHTCERIANIKNISYETVAETTLLNAKQFFRIK